MTGRSQPEPESGWPRPLQDEQGKAERHARGSDPKKPRTYTLGDSEHALDVFDQEPSPRAPDASPKNRSAKVAQGEPRPGHRQCAGGECIELASAFYERAEDHDE